MVTWSSDRPSDARTSSRKSYSSSTTRCSVWPLGPGLQWAGPAYSRVAGARSAVSRRRRSIAPPSTLLDFLTAMRLGIDTTIDPCDVVAFAAANH